LLDILRPRGEHQQELGYRAELAIGGIEQDAADLLAYVRAAGLDSLKHRITFVPETLGKEADLSAFAAAVGSFKRN
jgi:hypothetical protein